jgi:transketolase
MREAFVETVTELLGEDPRVALVLAEISAADFRLALRAHPDRAVNVGIREQLMLGVAGGLALTGLRPIAHSYASFVVDRAYEQVKLDLDHQDAGAVLVSVGASYDYAAGGRTHHSPGDVALFDTLDGWTVHLPGHADEVKPLLRTAARHDGRVYVRLSTRSNREARNTGPRLRTLRRGRAAAVVAVGPMLDNVLAATEGLDVTVAYTNTPRPFDAAGLRGLGHDDVVLVEPYLAGTSARPVARALADRPHRALHLGVGTREPRRYGTVEQHDEWHGLDPAGLRRSISGFLRGHPAGAPVPGSE